MRDTEPFEHSRMPDFQDSQPRRRAADNPNFSEIPPDMWRLLTDIRDRGMRLETMMSGVNSAFVKNEDGQPDYHGHRHAHSEMIKNAATIESIKGDLTKKVLGAIVVLVMSLMGSGLLLQFKDMLK